MFRQLLGDKGKRSAIVDSSSEPRQPVSGELRPVVYLPTWVEWNSMKQRPQFLLEAFAKAGHDVWFIRRRSAREIPCSIPASTPTRGWMA